MAVSHVAVSLLFRHTEKVLPFGMLVEESDRGCSSGVSFTLSLPPTSIPGVRCFITFISIFCFVFMSLLLSPGTFVQMNARVDVCTR